MAERVPDTGLDEALLRMTIVAEPLSAEGFAPFGTVIEHGGTGARRFVPAAFAMTDEAQPHLWVNQITVAPGPPFVVTMLERHPFSAQSFLPLSGGRWLVVVAPVGLDGKPRPDQIRAFVTRRHQGLTYHRGVWHSGLVALDEPAEVAVVMGLTGTDDDTRFDQLARSAEIVVPPQESP